MSDSPDKLSEVQTPDILAARRSPWIILSKTNSNCTPKSLLINALVKGSVGCALYGAVIYCRTVPTEYWQFKLSIWTILCTLIGALFNWQHDDSAE